MVLLLKSLHRIHVLLAYQYYNSCESPSVLCQAMFARNAGTESLQNLQQMFGLSSRL